MSRAVKIASVYPIALHADRNIYMGTFDMPGVPLGAKPEILEIRDHYQFEPLPMFYGTGPGGRQKQDRKTILAIEIAQDLIKAWTRDPLGCNENSHPGVWIVRDVVYLFDDNGRPQLDADNQPAYREATDAERKTMWAEDEERSRAAQNNYIEYCIIAGNVMAEEPKKIPFIPQFYRTLAKYAGQSPKWLNRIADANTKGCQWCAQVIPSVAVVCPNCGKVVDIQRHAQMEKEQQEAAARINKGVPTPPVKAA